MPKPDEAGGVTSTHAHTDDKDDHDGGTEDDEKQHHHLHCLYHDLHDPCYLDKMHPEDRLVYQKLLCGNRQFVATKIAEEGEDYFARHADTQSPTYLIIGCSDSRVHPDQLTGTKPGDIFIHRNVANLVVNTDLNLMSVLQYAVEVLKVKHVIVLGHYNCGGVKASMEKTYHGLIDKWLRNLKDVQRLHYAQLSQVSDFDERFKLMVRLNVQEQTLNLCKTSIIQKAWTRGQNVHVHGWVYDLREGILRDLSIEEQMWSDIAPIYGLRFPDVEQEREKDESMKELMQQMQEQIATLSACKKDSSSSSCQHE